MKKNIIFVFLFLTSLLFGEIIIQEDFSAAFPPNGWQTSGGGNWEQGTGNNAGGTAPEAQFNWSPSTTAIQRLQSPAVNTVGATELDLEFKHSINDYNGGYEIRLETSSDGTTWNTVQVFPSSDLPATTENITITTPDVGSATFQVAWTFDGNSFNINYWYVDDVLLEGTLITYDNDLAAMSITGNTIINAGNTENYEIAVKNVGYNTQDTYTVKLFKNNTQLSSIDITDPIAPEETIIHSLVWNVPDDEPSGTVFLHGEVTLTGDENTANDITGDLEVLVYPQGIIEITVGEGTDNNTRTPVCFEYNNSLTEIIYFADELAGAEGMITAVTYYNNFTDDLLNKPTALWIGETTQTNLTNGWIPSTSLTEVFNGTVSYYSGYNDITIQLTTPYYYNGGNLVVMAFRPMDTQNYGTMNYFLHDTTPEHIDRTRYERDNSVIIDPANPPTGYSNEYFANTTFTFFLGAMGEVEGHVLDDSGNPLDGAQVTIEETQTITYSDDLGYYHFGNVLAGTYDFTAEITGYSPQTITQEVIEDEVLQLDFNLIPLGQVDVSGHVVGSDLPSVGLENAIVQITGFENYEATTDANGDFIINGVYTNVNYDLQITYEGYDNLNQEIQVGSTALDLGTLTLNEIAYPPGNLLAIQNALGTEVELSWSSPGQGGGEFRYDDDNQNFLFGLNSTPPNAVFGAVHPNISVINEIHWFLCSDYGSHSQVKLYLFGLDDDDKPDTDNVIYESGFIPNVDDEWNIHEIAESIEAYEGFYVGVSTPNEYTSIGLDDGEGEPWEFQDDTQFVIENWVTGGQWTELSTYGPNYARNFMIRAYGINMGNTALNEVAAIASDSSSRSFEAYNVYRFYENQHYYPADWELIAEEIEDTTYVDTDWVNLPNATYQFAIRSVYTNGVESLPAYSISIIKSSASANDLPTAGFKLNNNYPNPFNPITTISFSVAQTPTSVELVIYNLKGQKVKTFSFPSGSLGTSEGSVVWNGTDDNNKPVSSGVYFYRLRAGSFVQTRRMLLLK